MPIDTPASRRALFSTRFHRAVLASAMTLSEVTACVRVVLALYMGGWGIGLLVNFARKLRQPRLERALSRATSVEERRTGGRGRGSTGEFGGIVVAMAAPAPRRAAPGVCGVHAAAGCARVCVCAGGRGLAAIAGVVYGCVTSPGCGGA